MANSIIHWYEMAQSQFEWHVNGFLYSYIVWTTLLQLFFIVSTIFSAGNSYCSWRRIKDVTWWFYVRILAFSFLQLHTWAEQVEDAILYANMKVVFIFFHVVLHEEGSIRRKTFAKETNSWKIRRLFGRLCGRAVF